MKLLFEPISKEVWYAVYDIDLFRFSHTTNISLSEFLIDEMNGNENICRDLHRTQWKFNKLGQRKYYIEVGELYSRDGWQEMTIV